MFDNLRIGKLSILNRYFSRRGVSSSLNFVIHVLLLENLNLYWLSMKQCEVIIVLRNNSLQFIVQTSDFPIGLDK